MKRIDEIVEAIEHGKFYDGETERDAVMYLELLRDFVLDAGQIIEYVSFWNKEKVEEDDGE